MNTKYYNLEKIEEHITFEFNRFNINIPFLEQMDLIDKLTFVRNTFKRDDYEYNKNMLETLTFFMVISNKDKFIDIMIDFIEKVYKFL